MKVKEREKTQDKVLSCFMDLFLLRLEKNVAKRAKTKGWFYASCSLLAMSVHQIKGRNVVVINKEQSKFKTT